MAKQRQLSEKEIRRVEEIDRITTNLSANGYKRKDMIISINYANIMAFVLGLPFLALFCIIFLLKNGFHPNITGYGYFIFIVFFILSIFVHEGIHGITWGLCAKNKLRSISFGFIKEYLTPYCTCSEPLNKRNYILGSIMPFLILGILPSIVGILCDSGLSLLLGLTMIFAAGGDLTIILKMLKYRSSSEDVIILDHPSECGFILFEK